MVQRNRIAMEEIRHHGYVTICGELISYPGIEARVRNRYRVMSGEMGLQLEVGEAVPHDVC